MTAPARKPDVVLCEFPRTKDGKAVIRVTVGEFRGKQQLSIRRHVRLKEGEEHVPTQKGVTLRPAEVAQFVDAIARAAAHIKAQDNDTSEPDQRRRHGRRLDADTRTRIGELRTQGVPAHEIAAAMGIGVATVYRVAAEAEQRPVDDRGAP